MKKETLKLKNWTGERLETFVESESTIEHLHRYAIAMELVKGKKILDIASGEGYGSNLLAGSAAQVIGVDISTDAISKAQSKYKKTNLKFKEGSATDIPYEDAFFDAVVSFETIEHHDEHEKMISEIKRVLKPGGFVIISSPDKLFYSDKRNYNNKFHVKELYENEFKDLIHKSFTYSDFYYQQTTFTSLIIPKREINSLTQYTGNYNEITENKNINSMFILAIASQQALPSLNASVFTDDEMIFKLNKIQIDNIKDSLSYKIGHSILSPFKFIRNMLRKADKYAAKNLSPRLL